MEALRETARRTVTYSIPAKDYAFLRRFARNMGWQQIPQPRARKCGLDRAIEAAKKGPLYSFDNVKDMMDFLNAED